MNTNSLNTIRELTTELTAFFFNNQILDHEFSQMKDKDSMANCIIKILDKIPPDTITIDLPIFYKMIERWIRRMKLILIYTWDT
jgi:hypothetical protein